MENNVAELGSWIIFNKLVVNDNKTMVLLVGSKQQFERVNIAFVHVGEDQITPVMSVQTWVWPMLQLEMDHKNPLHLDVVDLYLRRMGDKAIPDKAPPSLESFYPPWVAGVDLPQSRRCWFFVSFTNNTNTGVF